MGWILCVVRVYIYMHGRGFHRSARIINNHDMTLRPRSPNRPVGWRSAYGEASTGCNSTEELVHSDGRLIALLYGLGAVSCCLPACLGQRHTYMIIQRFVDGVRLKEDAILLSYLASSFGWVKGGADSMRV